MEGANSVVGKLRLILESFTIEDDQISLSDLARRTGISKASVHRLAQELLAWGMLERAGQEYRLGMRAFELGSRVPRFRVLRDSVRPAMEQLHQETREVVHLGVLDGQEVLYLEKVSASPQAARPSRIAGRMPLHCTASGKVLLAHAPSALLEDVIAQGLPRVSAGTVIAPGLLLEQVRQVRERGYAVEQEETTVGYSSVAVPLYGGSGLVLGALSLTAPTFRVDVDRLVAQLRRTVRRIRTSGQLN
ncbi:IclR family transcriptional regulator [Nocardioides kongjuensis]|uniref:DNA-binding IclR family transcriptional regulator n=1 Tax=Nocardioides kongjuensis TaxID=349522 RepID=A0A852RT33_9ACTN|nr:DNA-binding IclR family transcriptional regulator [Nocardioides kongjuensis]